MSSKDWFAFASRGEKEDGGGQIRVFIPDALSWNPRSAYFQRIEAVTLIDEEKAMNNPSIVKNLTQNDDLRIAAYSVHS